MPITLKNATNNANSQIANDLMNILLAFDTDSILVNQVSSCVHRRYMPN